MSAPALMNLKLVRGTADLAIAAAQPLMQKTLHVGQPNVESREAFLALAGEIFDRSWFTNDGPLVRRFERQVETYLGVRHCVAACNGTMALMVAIKAMELTGEVIVPSFTFVATAHALQWLGLTPIFADIDPETHNLDPESVRRLIGPRTSAIMGVHLWGRPAPVEQLQSLADEHGLQLLFDAAHAFGCSREGKMIGGFGRAEVLSFHTTKFFNTFEGGAVVTNDDRLAEAVRSQRNFGFAGFDNATEVGTNAKMTEVCAAMGLANFPRIGDMIAVNQANYASYCEALSDLPGIRVIEYPPSEQCNFQYVVLEVASECPLSRDDLVTALMAENILARRYFWPGCHRMRPYRELFSEAGRDLPNTELVSDRVVVLPTGSAVDDATCRAIARIIRVLVESATEERDHFSSLLDTYHLQCVPLTKLTVAQGRHLQDAEWSTEGELKIS